MSKKKPATAVYSTRTDLRVLAALAEYWHNQGEHPGSISQLHRLSIEVFVAILQSKGIVKTYPTTQSAIKYLKASGLFDSLTKRNRHLLMKQLQKEDLVLEGINPKYLKRSGRAKADQFEVAREMLEKKIGDKGAPILGANLGEVKDD
jgi:hypothetical protein